jgi:tRNA pseudouridine55 synthase
VTSDGVLLIAKPPGVTSHDVVARVRREIGRGTKVGHAGTLDPFATGLLLVLLGRATRVQRFLTALPKTYRAVARLGWTSDTGDRDGSLAHTGRVPETLELPVGEIMQRPPAYSAVKVEGERLHRRARRGDPVEGEPRPVTVHRFELLWRDPERAGLEVECSSGTYVRQLVAALGDAYCEELERTAIGPFRLEEADPGRVVPLEEALSFLSEVPLVEDEAERAAHGVAIERRPAGSLPDQDAIRLTHAGRLVAVARLEDGDRLKPYVVLAP